MKIAHGSKVQFIRRRNSCRYLRIVPQFKFVTRKMIDNCGSLGSAVHTLLQNCQNVRILKAELPKRHRRRSVYNIMAVHRNGAQLSRKFFTSLLQPSSCLHILLPTPRDPITTRLRSAHKFPRLPSRTRKYQTFISYALAHYQTS